MKYEKIKTPEELYEYMQENIKYGLVDKDNNVYEWNQDSFQVACQQKWYFRTPEEIRTSGYGHCWDQVEIEREWFEKNNYEFKTIFIWFLFDFNNSYPTHTYIIYKNKNNNSWNWFEHADRFNQGIKNFKTEKEAIMAQLYKHIEFAKKYNEVGEEELKHIKIYEFKNPKYGCNMSEYINNILDNAVDITDAIVDFNNIKSLLL